MERVYNHCILNEIAKKYNNLVSALPEAEKNISNQINTIFGQKCTIFDTEFRHSKNSKL